MAVLAGSKAARGAGRGCRYLEEVPEDIKLKKVPSASVTLQIQWVPFDFQ